MEADENANRIDPHVRCYFLVDNELHQISQFRVRRGAIVSFVSLLMCTMIGTRLLFPPIVKSQRSKR